jgi:hypothetical protein
MPSSLIRRGRTVVMLFLVLHPRVAGAQSATQTLTFAINAINQIAFVGTPSLTITTAVAGAAPTSVTNAVAAGVVASASRVVTYTITGGT